MKEHKIPDSGNFSFLTGTRVLIIPLQLIGTVENCERDVCTVRYVQNDKVKEGTFLISQLEEQLTLPFEEKPF